MDRFVWDEAKNADNIRERGFGFEIVYLLDWSTVAIEKTSVSTMARHATSSSDGLMTGRTTSSLCRETVPFGY
jgi:uncharacterized DUF497 family protein